MWFSADPSLRTDLLPQKQDGVQQILQVVLPVSTPDDLLTKFFITLWYLWKARNDNRFNRKTWTPLQVHHAVQAHLSSHRLAQQDQHIADAECSASPLQDVRYPQLAQGTMISVNAGTSHQ